MKRWLRTTLVVSSIAFVAIQFYPTRRENPPAESELVAPAEVEAIFKRSCYDCHSNETNWRWYAYVAPVSWLIASDVEHGRRQLNFSKWGTYSAKKRQSKADEILDEISSGDMPLPSYVRVHPNARLAPPEVEILKRWAGDKP
jgi:mono/diheme cytochrome c family protein